MTRAVTVFTLVCLSGFAVWMLSFGGSATLAGWASEQQQSVQSALAGALRAVKRGELWALGSLLALCFSYGFFHAAGPGHGKLVIGGYALSSTANKQRVILLTLASSLGQGIMAIALVSIGALVFDLSRPQMVALADESFALASALAICAVGLWLALRGTRRLIKAPQSDHTCCHGHGPTEAQVTKAQSWQEAVPIVFSIAIRPCTGALFVLILTYSMGIWAAGILGVLAMSLGTSLVTLGVGLSAFGLRFGLDYSLGSRVAMACIEVFAGLLICILALQTVLRLF